jgi:histidine triad (HIT) family protein
MSDQPTVFTKIIKGEIPCFKVHEDEHTFAFLDINPLSPGHTLLIPKEQVTTLGELSDDAAAAIGRVLPRLCRAVVKATGIADYNILQNNGELAHQAVNHVHFHIIPKPDTKTGLGVGWPSGELDKDSASKLAESISSSL